MTRKRMLQGAAAIALTAWGPAAFAADHLDSPAASMDPVADITDVYAWMDGNNAILVLNVAPLADANSKFSDAIQYAVHLKSSPKFGDPGDSMDIICTFAADQTISCWAGDKDYVTGDASATAGLKSASGKMRVFAGLRADPFYFNLDGFKDTVKTVVAAAPTLTFDEAGCPAVDAATSAVLVGELQGTNSGADPAVNFFENLNVLSIVVEIDKTLITSGGPVVSVWGSTHKAGG